MNPAIPRAIHVVGSVPLGSAREVFTACTQTLGNRLHKIPDGETAERSMWIGWQHAVLQRAIGLESIPDSSGFPQPMFRKSPGHTGPIEFGALGYAETALDSWAVFQKLEQKGLLRPEQRFQVDFPTPLAVALLFAGGDAECVEAGYRLAMAAELRQVLAAIPHGRLAVQWDVAVEVGILEGVFPVFFEPAFEGIVARLAQLIEQVPEPVEVGLHLCYGDFGHKHFKQPEHLGLLVRIANAVTAASGRPLQWLHMPVPADRTDDSYFEPLRQLRLGPKCQLFLGLVHDTDGAEGTKRRMAAAARHAPEDFGIATECGWGRRDPATIQELLLLHTAV